MQNIPDENADTFKETNNTEPSAVKASENQDLHDSQHDLDRMKPESFTLDLPDVADIPGQEYVHVLQLGGLTDSTISSADEEGVGLFDDENDGEDNLDLANESNVDPAEKKALRTASEDIDTEDNTSLRESTLDNRDNEGTLLNEGSSGTKISGSDLDVAGADEDDYDEEIGEEDEENNDYSLGGDDNDEPTSNEF